MSDAAGAAPAAGAGESTTAGPGDAAQGAKAAAATPGTSPQPGQPGIPNQPTKSELKELAEDNLDQMVSVKVDGQLKKMTVREALKQAELGGAAQRRMQEAAQIRKDYQKLMEDENEYFKRRGLDPDQFAEQRLVKKYEKLAMTPEQIKAQEREEKLKSYESRESQEREQYISKIKELADNLPPQYLEALKNANPEQLAQELRGAQARYDQQRQAIEREFIEAWEQTGLPKDTIFGSWVSSLMHASQLQKNSGQAEQALNAKEAAAIVKQNFLGAVARITGTMDAEGVHQLLGPETMKKLRAFDVQRVTGKTAPSFERQNSPGSKPASSRKSQNSVDERGWKAVFAGIK